MQAAGGGVEAGHLLEATAPCGGRADREEAVGYAAGHRAAIEPHGVGYESREVHGALAPAAGDGFIGLNDLGGLGLKSGLGQPGVGLGGLVEPLEATVDLFEKLQRGGIGALVLVVRADGEAGPAGSSLKCQPSSSASPCRRRAVAASEEVTLPSVFGTKVSRARWRSYLAISRSRMRSSN